MRTKLEAFAAAEQNLKEQQRIVGYFEHAQKRLAAEDRLFIEGTLCGKEVRGVASEAIARALVEAQALAHRLEDELCDRLK